MKEFFRKIRKIWHKDISLQSEKNLNDIKAAISWSNLEFIRFRDGVIRTTPRKTIKLCFDIIEKCNLNCVGCLTYAPLASKISGGGI